MAMTLRSWLACGLLALSPAMADPVGANDGLAAIVERDLYGGSPSICYTYTTEFVYPSGGPGWYGGGPGGGYGPGQGGGLPGGGRPGGGGPGNGGGPGGSIGPGGVTMSSSGATPTSSGTLPAVETVMAAVPGLPFSVSLANLLASLNEQVVSFTEDPPVDWIHYDPVTRSFYGTVPTGQAPGFIIIHVRTVNPATGQTSEIDVALDIGQVGSSSSITMPPSTITTVPSGVPSGSTIPGVNSTSTSSIPASSVSTGPAQTIVVDDPFFINLSVYLKSPSDTTTAITTDPDTPFLDNGFNAAGKEIVGVVPPGTPAPQTITVTISAIHDGTGPLRARQDNGLYVVQFQIFILGPGNTVTTVSGTSVGPAVSNPPSVVFPSVSTIPSGTIPPPSSVSGSFNPSSMSASGGMFASSSSISGSMISSSSSQVRTMPSGSSTSGGMVSPGSSVSGSMGPSSASISGNMAPSSSSISGGIMPSASSASGGMFPPGSSVSGSMGSPASISSGMAPASSSISGGVIRPGSSTSGGVGGVVPPASSTPGGVSPSGSSTTGAIVSPGSSTPGAIISPSSSAPGGVIAPASSTSVGAVSPGVSTTGGVIPPSSSAQGGVISPSSSTSAPAYSSSTFSSPFALFSTSSSCSSCRFTASNLPSSSSAAAATTSPAPPNQPGQPGQASSSSAGALGSSPPANVATSSAAGATTSSPAPLNVGSSSAVGGPTSSPAPPNQPGQASSSSAGSAPSSSALPNLPSSSSSGAASSAPSSSIISTSVLAPIAVSTSQSPRNVSSLAPLSCQGPSYETQNKVLYSINLITGQYTILTSAVAVDTTNALAYHPQENYLYAVAQNNHYFGYILRIGAGGVHENTTFTIPQTNPSGTGATSMTMGEIDVNLQFWLGYDNGNGWVQVDMNSANTATYGQVVNSSTADRGIYIVSDWAYLPAYPNRLYALGQHSLTGGGYDTELMYFDLTTKAWTNVFLFQTIAGGASGKAQWGAVYTAADGYLYGLENNSGQVWKFKVDSPTQADAIYVSQRPVGSTNDGARCMLNANLNVTAT